MITRQRGDAALAALMALVCASLKFEGSIWALTLVPGVVTALNRRAGLALMGAGAAVAFLYLAFGPAELPFLGYALQTRFVDVSRPLYEHMFVMDDWHLLWYAVLAVIAVNARRLFDEQLAPMSVTVLSAAAFILVLFFFTTASAGVREESTTNRLLLHTVAVLVFYVALILRARQPQPKAAPAPT
jgi:hypothetical protein